MGLILCARLLSDGPIDSARIQAIDQSSASMRSGESPGIIITVHRNGGSSGCRYPRSVCICLRLRCLDNSLAQLRARGRSPPTPRTYLLWYSSLNHSCMT